MTEDHSKAFSCWLDLFRWTASMAVLLAHVALIVLPPYYEVKSHTLLFTAYSFMSGFAHQAVMVFFVLSGYLVGGSFLNSFKKKNYIFSDYITKRLIRLWIVIVPALILAFGLAAYSIYIEGNGEFPLYVAYQQEKLSLVSFVGTLLFTQTFAVPAFAFDAPLWSLSSEFIYYLAFPALGVALFDLTGVRRIAAIASILAVLSAITYFQFSGSSILPYFTIWIFGAIASQVQRNHLGLGVPATALIAAGLLFASRFVMIGDFESYNPFQLFLLDIAIGLSFSILLVSMRFSNLIMPPWPKIHHWLAGFSFSLYCIHYPLSLFLSSMMLSRFGTGYKMDPGALSTWAIVLLFLLTNFVASYLFSLATEANTDSVRKYLMRRPSVRH